MAGWVAVSSLLSFRFISPLQDIKITWNLFQAHVLKGLFVPMTLFFFFPACPQLQANKNVFVWLQTVSVHSDNIFPYKLISGLWDMTPSCFREQGGYASGFSCLVKNMWFTFLNDVFFHVKRLGGGEKTEKLWLMVDKSSPVPKGSYLPFLLSKLLFQTCVQMIQSAFWWPSTPDAPSPTQCTDGGCRSSRAARQDGSKATACPRLNYVVGFRTVAGQTGLYYLHIECPNLGVMRHNNFAVSTVHAQNTVAMHGVPDTQGRVG